MKLEGLEGKVISYTGVIKKVLSKYSANQLTSLILQDNSGFVEAKSVENEDKFVVGDVISIDAKVIKNKSYYLEITSFKLLDYTPEYIEEHFLQPSFSIKTHQNYLINEIKKINDCEIRKVVEYFVFEKYEKELLRHPAAISIHHEYHGGLLDHIVSMLKLASGIIDTYPWLSSDLIRGGIILHDLGKIEEINYEKGVTSLSDHGKLVGHISIFHATLVKYLKEQNISPLISSVLEHLVLSHHGKLEFGSPILPQLAEAEVVQTLDHLDFQMNLLFKNFDKIDDNSFTNRIGNLEGRAYFKVNLNNKK